MASIGPITLEIDIDVANANITASYTLTGSAFDVASGQPYTEQCELKGDDSGIVPAEDGVDDTIVEGTLTTIFSVLFPVVFANTTPINRVRTKTIPKANLNEDIIGLDEIRALVTLTPRPAVGVSRESNQVTGSF